jgi:hypothetical protein
MNENITAEQITEAIDWASDCLGLSRGVKVSAERALAYVKSNYPGGWEAFVAEVWPGTQLRAVPTVSLKKRYRLAVTPDGRWAVEQAPTVFPFVSRHRNGIGTMQCRRFISRKANGFNLN